MVVVVVVVIIMITVRTLIEIIIRRWHMGIITTTVLIILGVLLYSQIRIRDDVRVVTTQLVPTGCPCFFGNTNIPWSRSSEGGVVQWRNCSIIMHHPCLGGFLSAWTSFVIRIINVNIVIIIIFLLGIFLPVFVTALLFIRIRGNTII